ncbi:MAG: molybdopterin-dependent oxidoreductase, partial [Hellea sp.]|nr:molybdopterin-dependent oxidoreductase [Hellea sp.]
MTTTSTEFIHARTCHICEANCGVLMTVRDGEVVSVKGNPDHVLSEGYICPKATAIPDLQNDPDRLRKPMKRTGNNWEEISWEQAFAEIAEKLDAVKAGPKVPAVYLGNPNAHNYATNFYMRGFLKMWGSKGIYSATTLDQIPHMIAQKWVYGHNALYPVPDIDRTQFMVIVGGNPMASNGSIWTVPNFRKRVQRLQERGGKLVVIDPRRTETAKVADEHHFVRPGTDTAFFLGVLKSLKTQNLIKPGRLEPMLENFPEFLARLDNFDLEALSAHCGIGADAIHDIAAQLGSGQPAIMYGRMGVSVVRFGTLNHYLINMINVATGNVDREGGTMFPNSLFDPVERSGTGSYGRYATRLKGSPEVLGELPSAELAAEMTTPGDGQIGALVTLAGNPVLSAPGGQHIGKAMEGLDLMVSIDMYITETTRHANYVLPPVGPLQNDHYNLFFAPLSIRNFAAYSDALYPKGEDELADWEILHGLTSAMKARGGDDAPPRIEPKLMLAEAIKSSPVGVTLEQIATEDNGYDMGPLQPRLPERLKTEHGKIECMPEMILPDLDLFEAQLSEANDNEFLLIGRRHIRDNNSWLHNSRRLVKGPNRCTMMIHPDSAGALGLEDGAMAKVWNQVGTVELETQITDDLMPGVISIP